MYFDYLNVLLFTSVGFFFVFINVAVGSLIRPKRTTEEGLETYECGELTTGETWIKFDIRYYTVALVYVVFAVEIAFLFPWAIVLEDAFNDTGVAAGTGVGTFALVEGVIFIAILFLGLAYVWAKGDLDWVLAYEDHSFRPGEAGPQTHTSRAVTDIEAAQDEDKVADAEPDGEDAA
ncbi:MAG: NADH-quinone oxidoreductase subunit A [Candidatus Paceibacteria bacterium]|jgi:NADH-quinone oxidoreductase subunit A